MMRTVIAFGAAMGTGALAPGADPLPIYGGAGAVVCACTGSAASSLLSDAFGVLAYWDADYSVTGTATVTQWTDQHNSYNVTPNSGKEPSLSAAQFSGKNSIKFLRSSSQNLYNKVTAALYGAADGDDPNVTIVWQSITATTPNTGRIWMFGGVAGASANRLDLGDNGSATQLNLNDNGATGSGTVTWTGLSSTTAAPHVYAVVLNGQTQTLYQDGTANGTVGAINATARTGSCFTIGAFGDTNLFPYDGFIRRLAIYPSALTAARVAAISTAWTGT